MCQCGSIYTGQHTSTATHKATIKARVKNRADPIMLIGTVSTKGRVPSGNDVLGFVKCNAQLRDAIIEAMGIPVDNDGVAKFARIFGGSTTGRCRLSTLLSRGNGIVKLEVLDIWKI